MGGIIFITATLITMLVFGVREKMPDFVYFQLLPLG